MNASEVMLPGSTERILSVSGVADAIHIAVYYIGTILLEYQERNPAPAMGAAGAYRQQAGGGHGGSSHGPGHGAGPGPAPIPSHGAGGPPSSASFSPNAAGPGSQTQQIFIPNSLVGASES